MRQWSYRQVTAAAETEIRQLVEQSTAKDPAERQLVRQWAYGVFLGWSSLTTGWQEVGDNERLKALATERP